MSEKTLDEFTDEQKELIEEFEKEWLIAHAKAPDAYPLELSAGDWDEAFYDYAGGPFETEGLE